MKQKDYNRYMIPGPKGRDIIVTFIGDDDYYFCIEYVDTPMISITLNKKQFNEMTDFIRSLSL